MTLHEITTQLDDQYNTWASAYKDDLDRAAVDPAITRKLTDFIEHSLRRAGRTTKTSNPLEVTVNAVRFTAVATYKFGMLVGLLLRDETLSSDPPPEEQLGDQLEPCTSCNMSGEVCVHCGFSRFACECAPDRYSPVRCAVCEGTGELDT